MSTSTEQLKAPDVDELLSQLTTLLGHYGAAFALEKMRNWERRQNELEHELAAANNSIRDLKRQVNTLTERCKIKFAELEK